MAEYEQLSLSEQEITAAFPVAEDIAVLGIKRAVSPAVATVRRAEAHGGTDDRIAADEVLFARRGRQVGWPFFD